MVLKMSTIAVILLAAFTTADLKRVKLEDLANNVVELREFEKQAQIEEENTTKPVFEVKIDKTMSAVDGAEADSAGAPVFALESATVLVQETASQVSSPSLNFTVRKKWNVVPNVAMLPGVVPNVTMLPYVPPRKMRRALRARSRPSIFSKTLDYISSASDYGQEAILKAACDSFAFSCEEIIQLADSTLVYYTGFLEELFAYQWKRAIIVFAEGRDGKGCISDPTNVESILDVYLSVWPAASNTTGYNVLNAQFRSLSMALLENEHLTPATNVRPPPMQLQTGLRTAEDMEKLLGDMKKLQLIKAYGSQGAAAWYVPGGEREEEFETWLKQIRAQGEQFSGSQLVSLVRAVPANSPIVQRHYGDQFGPFRVLLQHLEQYVTGVTCEEVNQIIQWMENDFDHSQYTTGFWPDDIEPLKSIIVDAQNKVDIVAFADLVKDAGDVSYMVPSDTEKLLQGVGDGLPAKNNPVFGVVKGNPVILVVDESTSMDTKFSLGNDTFTRREFCKIQVEAVLEGLPNGTYFNVIQYSSSAVKIFQKPVLASKMNINAAIQAMGTRWTSNFTGEQDPVEVLRHLQVFALQLKHQLNQSTERNSTEALELAYATAHSPLRDGQNVQNDDGQKVTQIYFLTSGQPDGGASQVLDNIDEFDKSRNIPVNSIAFITPTDVAAKHFVKDLARKTGGFFRPIEQDTKKRKRDPSEK